MATVSLGWAVVSLMVGGLIWAVVIARLYSDLRASREASKGGSVVKGEEIVYDNAGEGEERGGKTGKAEDGRDEA